MYIFTSLLSQQEWEEAMTGMQGMGLGGGAGEAEGGAGGARRRAEGGAGGAPMHHAIPWGANFKCG